MRHLLRNIVLPFVLFGLITFHALPSRAQDLTAEEMVKLKAFLAHIRVVEGEVDSLKGPHILYEGVNVHLRSGSGSTDDGVRLTGLGNLVVGYNEEPNDLDPGERDGSHNLIIGREHRFLSFGGLVAGHGNTVSGREATITGGNHNVASGPQSSISGVHLAR